MDQAERELSEGFTQLRELAEQEPPFPAAFTATAARLAEARERAQSLLAEGPPMNLSEAQRDDLAGCRFPELEGVLTRLAEALGRQPELAADMQAQPTLLTRLVSLDRALSRLALAGELLCRGGESGELLTGAALSSLCQAALSRAGSARGDSALSADQRNAVATVFSEPARLEAARRERGASFQPGQVPVSAAEESAAMARLIEVYLAAERGGA